MRFAIGILFVASWIIGGAAASRAASVQSDVAALLARSASAWNRGDLDAFMQSYANSPHTLYMNATTIVYGYAAIRARYARHYRAGQMGALSVSNLAVRRLGANFAVATARWHLARPKSNGGNLSGLFSLVLERNRRGWRIISDHTP